MTDMPYFLLRNLKQTIPVPSLFNFVLDNDKQDQEEVLWLRTGHSVRNTKAGSESDQHSTIPAPAV